MNEPPVPRIFRRTAAGARECRVCQGVNGHDPACPIARYLATMDEMAGTLGIYVADQRELFDQAQRGLRDEDDPAGG